MPVFSTSCAIVVTRLRALARSAPSARAIGAVIVRAAAGGDLNVLYAELPTATLRLVKESPLLSRHIHARPGNFHFLALEVVPGGREPPPHNSML
jgi:hypothetical protein